MTCISRAPNTEQSPLVDTTDPASQGVIARTPGTGRPAAAGPGRRSGRSRRRRRQAPRRPGAGPETRPAVIDERAASSGAHTPPGRNTPSPCAGHHRPAPDPPGPRHRLPDPPRLVGGGAGPVTGVDPGPPHPGAQDSGADSQPPRRSDAPPPGRSGPAPATRRHPSRPPAQLQRALPQTPRQCPPPSSSPPSNPKRFTEGAPTRDDSGVWHAGTPAAGSIQTQDGSSMCQCQKS